MIPFLIYVLFVVIYIVEYVFSKVGLNSRAFAIIPEMISIAIAVYALLYFALTKKFKIKLSYIFFFCSFALHIVIGAVGNHVQPLAVIAGMRNYFKFLPLFFLPMIFDQSNEQIKTQLKLLLVMAIAQFPLSLFQRLFEYTSKSGDRVAGTLERAPILTIFLVCTISILVGFYIRKQLTTKNLVVLLIIAFIPTAINETKATVVLLPLAAMIPAFLAPGTSKQIKKIALILPISLFMIMGFHYLYKMFYSHRSDIVEFYTTDSLSEYLYKDVKAREVTGVHDAAEVGRIDAIVIAYKENSKDLLRLIWGVGVGNAAPSFSRKFQGKYADEFRRLGGKENGISNFMWEIGILGIAHIYWFLYLIFNDALYMRKINDLPGFLALGWLGVTAIIALSLFYQNMITMNGLIYPFFYLSGLISAHRYLAPKQDERLQYQ